MKRAIDAFVARQLTRWVAVVDAHARLVVVIITATTILAGVHAVLFLGINSDNLSIISDQLPSRAAYDAFNRHFPNLDEAIFVVVDGATPERSREAALALEAELAGDDQHFEDAYIPGGGDFFERHGLLYRSEDELDRFGDQMARIQPLIAELEADPSISNMTEALQLGLEELDTSEDAIGHFSMVLDRVSDATRRVYDEAPLQISWEELILDGTAIDTIRRRVIVVHPILDYGHVLMGHAAIDRIREAASELGLDERSGVTVRITGNPALNYDEMLGFIWDLGGAGAVCFCLVAFILSRAMRSFRLVLAALVTLVFGLVWTASFTAASIGHLNQMTLSFAILYIGLGVDFAIHLGVGYAALLRAGIDHRAAIRRASSHVGGSLFFCTFTTAIGFFVFVPSDYRGMAELGLIAGSSMFIILFLTMTLFPALLGSWLAVDPERHIRADLNFTGSLFGRIGAHPALIRWAALALGIGALYFAPTIRFQPNVVEMRDPRTESVQAMRDLLDDTNTTPWYMNAMRPSLAEADVVADRVEALDDVALALTLSDFVPEDQETKLEILADIAFLFDSPLPSPGPRGPEPSVADQVEALERLAQYLADPEIPEDAIFASGSPTSLGRSIDRLRAHLEDFLQRLEENGDPAASLAELERVLMASLPDQLDRLRKALSADVITLDSLPESLRERMLAEGGIARIQVFPVSNLRRHTEFRAFVDSVKSVIPDTTGVPVNLVEMGRVVEQALIQSMSAAIVLIAMMLYLMWRRLSDVLLVMTPLCLGAVLTLATMVIFDRPFDYTNVVVVPLLFGIGVDSAIHIIHESRVGETDRTELVYTSTARAVYYSALTTIVSFGSLSLAGHNGMKGLGFTLTAGLVYTVVCVLFLLPALMALQEAPDVAKRDAQVSADAS